MVIAETKLETRALWLLLLPQLPSLVLVCTRREDHSPWKSWGRHPGEKPDWCGWERGVYSDSKLGQRVSICSQEIFSPYEKYFTWVIPKEGKEDKSQVKWWAYMDRRKGREKTLL